MFDAPAAAAGLSLAADFRSGELPGRVSMKRIIVKGVVFTGINFGHFLVRIGINLNGAFRVHAIIFPGTIQ